MVEAPGTAPGSDGFITIAIYRHSCFQHPQYRELSADLQSLLRPEEKYFAEVSIDRFLVRHGSAQRIFSSKESIMSFQITVLYASIFTIMAIVLSNMVSSVRADANISILHRDNQKLALRMRRHGNFIESIPLAIILMGLVETQGIGSVWLHGMGVLLIAARLAHIFGLDAEKTMSPLRLAGGIGTQLAMVGAVGYLLWTLLF